MFEQAVEQRRFLKRRIVWGRVRVGLGWVCAGGRVGHKGESLTQVSASYAASSVGQALLGCKAVYASDGRMRLAALMVRCNKQVFDISSAHAWHRIDS